MKKLIIFPLILLIILSFVNFLHAETSLIKESFTVDEGGTLYLNTDAATLKIESHGQDTVDVTFEQTSLPGELTHIRPVAT